MNDRQTKTFAEVATTDNEVIRITLDVDHGRERVKLRAWFKDDAGEWRPGAEGIKFKLSEAPAIVSGILRVRP